MYKASEDSYDRVERFLTTTFAGNSDAFMMELIIESMAIRNNQIPLMYIYVAKGGDGKSLRSVLRANVFADKFAYLSTSCFLEDEEFRKQGGQVADKRFITIQECEGGASLIEETFKKFASGEKLPCRPNYGINTTYYSWGSAGKFWEMNLNYPSIKGDPSKPENLKSWTRRLYVVQMRSSYTAPCNADPENKVFKEDAGLRCFLDSAEAEKIYLYAMHVNPGSIS